MNLAFRGPAEDGLPRLPGSLHVNRRLDRWLAFDPGGTVTISPGKVELGQGILTALAQIAADELDVPLVGTVPLTMPLREQADAGLPLVLTDPDDAASQAVRSAARGIIADTPIKLPVLSVIPSAAPINVIQSSPAPAGMSLPMAR